jgi:hypothetical protein
MRVYLAARRRQGVTPGRARGGIMDPLTPFPLIRWGFVVLGSDMSLSETLRNDLLTMAIQAYLDDQTAVDFDWEGAVGRLTTQGDAVSLESFVGQSFVAEIETEEGTGKVNFLVTEAQLRMAAEARDASPDWVN